MDSAADSSCAVGRGLVAAGMPASGFIGSRLERCLSNARDQLRLLCVELRLGENARVTKLG
jgi:hypothetical protein